MITYKMEEDNKLTNLQARKIAEVADHGCSMAEVALSISYSLEQFENTPQALKIYHEYYGLSLIKLRQAQMQKARDGDSKMLVFLGKNLLGQSDNPTLVDAANKLSSTFSELTDAQLKDKILKMEKELRSDA